MRCSEVGMIVCCCYIAGIEKEKEMIAQLGGSRDDDVLCSYASYARIVVAI